MDSQPIEFSHRRYHGVLLLLLLLLLRPASRLLLPLLVVVLFVCSSALLREAGIGESLVVRQGREEFFADLGGERARSQREAGKERRDGVRGRTGCESER
jgi:hypothetical protein